MTNIFAKDQQTKLEKEKEEERKETLKVTGLVITMLIFLCIAAFHLMKKKNL